MFTNYSIFLFVNSFILFWLPLRIQNKILFSINLSNYNNLIYNFKGFPIISEIEKLLETNDYYFKILNQFESKLIINTTFKNLVHKETFARILKFPLGIK